MLARYRKFIVAIIGFVATVANANIFGGHTEQVLMLVISGATMLGVYGVPNARTVVTGTTTTTNQ